VTFLEISTKGEEAAMMSEIEVMLVLDAATRVGLLMRIEIFR
jgi:hypothetical protein